MGMWEKHCKTIEIFFFTFVNIVHWKILLYFPLKIAFSVIDYLDLYILC